MPATNTNETSNQSKIYNVYKFELMQSKSPEEKLRLFLRESFCGYGVNEDICINQQSHPIFDFEENISDVSFRFEEYVRGVASCQELVGSKRFFGIMRRDD
jgi:hypothetical protein